MYFRTITFKKLGFFLSAIVYNTSRSTTIESMESAALTPPKIFKPKIKSLVIVTVGATIGFAGFNLYKGNEKFYRQFVMPTVRLLPAETSHNLGVLACKYNLFRGLQRNDDAILKTPFFGKTLSNPVGIAAGFDKQGEAVEGLHQIGFGFVEIGSVTPNPQSGNPTPRVFRLIDDEAIINRYGFNSEGHKVVYERLRDLKKNGNFNGVLGVNLGKNKESPSAVADYVQGVELFGPIADYLVVNVSSPNTPGLRDFQAKKELEKILERVIDTRNKLPYNSKVPILLKIAPDLQDHDIKDIVTVINQKNCRVDGLIVSNTTIARDNLKEEKLAQEAGGLSGAPLRDRSTQLIANLYSQTQGKIPIIGVGGISTGEDAFKKLEAGASYVQFYTALIFHGPPIVNKIKNELSNILREQGYNSVQDVVGKNYKKYLNSK